MFFYIFVLGLLLLEGQLTEAAAFTTTPVTAGQQQMSKVETIQSSAFVSKVHLTSVTSKSPTTVPLTTSLPPVSRITSPPSPKHLELRQRCWNDQGFSVDCAAWTGYRYSWGPSSNPYDYWSGGGTGSGGGGTVSSDASKTWTMRSHIAILLVTFIGVCLSAMISSFWR